MCENMTNVSIVSNPRHRELSSVSGGNTILTILKGIFSCWSPETGMDWGTAIALIAIGALLAYSVYQTIIGDLGYLVDAFT